MPEVLDKETIKALSTETRQEIMKMLAKRPHTASEIAKTTKKHVTTVSEHLDVLEKSGLIRKKESSNKWVYYELTDKGEHLFKPQFYSWIVVLSLSVVLMFVGFLRIFNENQPGYLAQSASNIAEKAGAAAPLAQRAAETAAGAPAVDYVGYALIVLGAIGLVYLAYRKYRK